MTTKYEPGGVTVSIGRSQAVQLPLRIFRVRLTGLLFETDKTFLLPIAMHGIRGLVDYYEAHPEARLVVTGHTDSVGDAAYNRALSDERAVSVGHYLKDEVEPWLACYQGSPHSKPWGTREDQHMLSAIRDDAGQPFYAGPVTGQLDAPTRDAVTRFQTARGLAIDGQPGPETRRALCTDYMKLDGTTLPPTAALETLGCGENHPEVPTPDGTDEPANRRVEIFLFDGPPEPPNPGTCPGGGCAYPEWKARAEEIVDFDHDLCELLVECHDDDAKPLAGALVRLTREIGDARELPTNEQGQAFFQNLIAGQYQVRGEKAGFATREQTIEVTSGGVGAADDRPVTRSNFADDAAGDGEPAPGTFSNYVVLSLNKSDIVIQIVSEIPDGGAPPGLFDAAREGVAHGARAPWERVAMHAQFGTERSIYTAVDVTGKIVIAVNDSGTALSTPVKEGVLRRIECAGPHQQRLVYTLRDDASPDVILTDPVIRSGETRRVKISTRARMSVWCFGSPFLNDPHSYKPDKTQLDRIAAARIDDVSLVDTICAAESNWAKDSTSVDVVWSDRLRPGGLGPRDAKLAGVRDQYIKDLVAELHARNAQLVLGYTIGNEGTQKPNPANDAYCRGFTTWLKGLTPDRVRAHAEAIAAFVAKYDADGIGFDLEIDTLGPDQKDNLALLYREVSNALAPRNGIVSYATAPFTSEGMVDTSPTLQGARTQPFSLARDIPNLIARPMCYIQDPIAFATIERSVDYAMGAAGLDPSQIQYGIYGLAPKQGGPAATAKFCTNKLRPNRIGMVWYQVSQRATTALHDLDACKSAEAKLNPGEAAPGTPGQPIQIPRTAPRVNP